MAVFAYSEGGRISDWKLSYLVPLVMLLLAVVTGWAIVRIVKHPVAARETPKRPAAFQQLLSLTPQQNKLLTEALERARQRDFPAAEALVDQALAGRPDNHASGCWPVVLMKFKYIVAQNDLERAEKLCVDRVGQSSTIEEKVKLLDAFASRILYMSAASILPAAERFVRQALELAPGSLTLQGTLGGILVEQGRFAEAEPLLKECLDRSPALHDQGISAFYLGVAKLGTGDSSEGRRLIKRGKVLHPEPWLLAKAERQLK